MQQLCRLQQQQLLLFGPAARNARLRNWELLDDRRRPPSFLRGAAATLRQQQLSQHLLSVITARAEQNSEKCEYLSWYYNLEAANWGRRIFTTKGQSFSQKVTKFTPRKNRCLGCYTVSKSERAKKPTWDIKPVLFQSINGAAHLSRHNNPGMTFI